MVGVGIKMIPTEVGKVHNIRFCNGSFVGDECIAYVQLFKILSKGMLLYFYSFGAGLIALCNGRYCCWRTLNGYPLHVMFYTSNATHFFAATRSSGTTVYQHRQR